MSFNPFSILSGPAEDVTANVGTPEKPIELSLARIRRNRLGEVVEVDSVRPVLTGARARDSWQKISQAWAAKPAADRDGEAFLPRDARRSRREVARADRRDRKKGRRNFVRREWDRERAAGDLLNLFLLADGTEPASPLHRYRAKGAIAGRVAYLRGVEQGQYDEQIARRQRDRSLPAPRPVRSHEEIEGQLRALASTATLPAKKVKQERPAEVDYADLTRRIDAATFDRLTLGRTGRAG